MTEVSKSFGRRAACYDAFASVQKAAGAELLGFLEAEYPGRKFAKAADLGAGTGNLIGGLAQRAERVLALDLSPEMLDVLSCRFSFAETACADFDAPEFFSLLEGCELAASCFALQWSKDIANFFERMGRNFAGGGRTAALAFPVSGTLRELKQAFSEAGADHFVNDFPDRQTVIEAARAAFSDVRLFLVNTHRVFFPDLLSLLHSVTKIGASTLMSRSGPKLSKSLLGRASSSSVWNEQWQNKFCATYEVAYIIAE